MQAPAEMTLPAVTPSEWDALWQALLRPADGAAQDAEHKETPVPSDLAAGGTGADQRGSDHDAVYSSQS